MSARKLQCQVGLCHALDRVEALLQSTLVLSLFIWTLDSCSSMQDKTVILNLSGCVTQGRQAGMQDNFDDLLIHIGSKAKKKSKKATLLRGWTMVQWSVRRAEEQMRCGWRGDLGMWVHCRADEGSGNRCIVECCSQGTWTGGKVPKVEHVFCVQLFCMLIYR